MNSLYLIFLSIPSSCLQSDTEEFPRISNLLVILYLSGDFQIQILENLLFYLMLVHRSDYEAPTSKHDLLPIHLYIVFSDQTLANFLIGPIPLAKHRESTPKNLFYQSSKTFPQNAGILDWKCH